MWRHIHVSSQQLPTSAAKSLFRQDVVIEVHVQPSPAAASRCFWALLQWASPTPPSASPPHAKLTVVPRALPGLVSNHWLTAMEVSASAELWQRSSKVVNLFRNFLDSWWSCFSTTIRAISSASVASKQSRQPSDLSFTLCSWKASWASRDRRLRGDSQWVCLKTGYNLYKILKKGYLVGNNWF